MSFPGAVVDAGIFRKEIQQTEFYLTIAICLMPGTEKHLEV